MDTTGEYPTQCPPSTPVIYIPGFAKIVLYLLAGAITLVFIALIATTREAASPFSDFSDLFGRDAIQSAIKRGFSCQNLGSARQPQGYCVQRDDHGAFHRILLRMSSGTIPDEISFSPTEGKLMLGDVAALLGKPDIWLYCEIVVAAWPAHQVMSLVAPSATGHVSYFTPIVTVSFASGGTPHWEQLLMNDVRHDCGSARKNSLGLQTYPD